MSLIRTAKEQIGDINSLSFAQKQRLSFIDFSLFFNGTVSRKELTAKFEMGMANATRDLAVYKELAPSNIEFDQTE